MELFNESWVDKIRYKIERATSKRKKSGQELDMEWI